VEGRVCLMAGMKISLVSAMRARDVSHPDRADEEAAELADSRSVKTATANGKSPAGAADLTGRSPRQPTPRQPYERR
jgi:hypothetical protein